MYIQTNASALRKKPLRKPSGPQNKPSVLRKKLPHKCMSETVPKNGAIFSDATIPATNLHKEVSHGVISVGV